MENYDIFYHFSSHQMFNLPGIEQPCKALYSQNCNFPTAAAKSQIVLAHLNFHQIQLCFLTKSFKSFFLSISS